VIQYEFVLVPYIDYEMKSKSNGPVTMLIRCVVYIRGVLHFTLPFMLQVFFLLQMAIFSQTFIYFRLPKMFMMCKSRKMLFNMHTTDHRRVQNPRPTWWCDLLVAYLFIKFSVLDRIIHNRSAMQIIVNRSTAGHTFTHIVISTVLILIFFSNLG
jgi:hypothetical protein